MTSHPRPLDLVPEDVLDLLVEDVAAGISDDDFGRIEPVLADPRLEHALDEVRLAAATASLAFADTADAEPMPDRLRLLCLGGIRAASQQDESLRTAPAVEAQPLRFSGPSVDPAPNRGSGVAGLLGWLAAAACLAVAIGAWWPAGTSTNDPADLSGTILAANSSPAELREALVEEATDLVVWRWQAWGPGYENVTGDVVWSEAAQEGYMRLEGLPINDPNREQYQLWIVESSRGTPLETDPVDGGVFDIPESGELIVPIRAKLRSTDVVAFGVTLEPPGGVVVSDRQRLTVLAAPDADAESGVDETP